MKLPVAELIQVSITVVAVQYSVVTEMARIALDIVISIIVGVFAIFDCISFALSLAAGFSSFYDGPVSAWICSTTFVGASFFTLLFVTLPACICHCREDDTTGCCTPTYYVSVAVAGSISVIGTFVAGILQTFTIYNYEVSDSSSILHAAAAFNLISALFGVMLIVVSLSICLCKEENWHFCKKRPYCMNANVVALIFITVLVIAVMIAVILNFFVAFSSFVDTDSPNSQTDRAVTAAVFSYVAAFALLLGFCIGGSFVCCPVCVPLKEVITLLSVIMCVWGFLASGTVISGGLMIKVGQSFSLKETPLNPDEPLNRASVSAMGYFIGVLNLVASIIAFLVFCTGVIFWNYRKIDRQEDGDNTYSVFVSYLFVRREYIVSATNPDVNKVENGSVENDVKE